jgi:hypothetical protein
MQPSGVQLKALRQRDAASEACVDLKRLVDQLRGEAAAASGKPRPSDCG